MNGRLINYRYEELELIGQGGMGTVYRVRDLLTGREVALKQVTMRRVAVTSSRDEDPHLLLAREFRLLAGLHHPSIISVLDYGFDEDRQPYFTMDFLPGARNILRACHNLPLADQVQLFIPMYEALAYLHRYGIVHRDLKPENVLVTPDRQVRLLDFGLAGEARRSTGVIGSLAYIAPEIFLEQPVTIGSDLYSTGVLMYQAFAGRHPFDTSTIQTLMMQTVHGEAPAEPLLERTGGNQALTEVVLRLLSKNPAKRYTGASEVIEALCAACGLPVPEETLPIRESYLQAAQFVGRHYELDRLETALTATLHGTGAAWLIGGESGIGKSRLLDELRIRALVAGALVIPVQGNQVARPGYLWQRILPYLLLTAPPSARTLETLADAFPEVLEVLPPHWYGLDAAASDSRRTARWTGDTQPASEHQGRLMQAMTELFTIQRHPVVLLLDDLHWMPDALPLVNELASLTASLPLLLIASYRHDDVPQLPDRLPAMQPLILNRLNPLEIGVLMTTMLDTATPNRQLVNILWEETGGNAFLLVEVLRELANEAGRLTAVPDLLRDGRLVTRQVLDIARNRLQRLPQEDLPLLHLAAVMGREFDPAVIHYLIPGQDESGWLLRAHHAALIGLSVGKWQFRHEKIREGILTDVDPAVIRQMHGELAAGIEALYPHDSGQVRSLLEHWYQAGNLTKTLSYTLRLTPELIRVGDFETAARYLQRTLTDLGDGPAAAPYEAEQLQLLLLYGDASEALGNFDLADQAYHQALHYAQTRSDRAAEARALVGQGKIAFRRWNYSRSVELYETALDLEQQIDNLPGIAACVYGLGTAQVFVSDYRLAAWYLEQSLSLHQELNNQMMVANTLGVLGVMADRQGKRQEAKAYAEQCLNLRREINDRRGISMSLNNLAVLAQVDGDYALARQYNQESLDLKQKIRDLDGIVFSLHNLASLAELEGDYFTALNYHHQALEHSRTRGIAAQVIHHLSDIAIVHTRLDQADEARQVLRELWQEVQGSPTQGNQLRLLWAGINFAVDSQAMDLARAWTGFLMDHPQRDFEMRERLPALVASLEPVLQPVPLDTPDPHAITHLETLVHQVGRFITAGGAAG